MSISSKATGLRPGVCTSTTRPTSPYTGQIIYETDTGQMLVWNGSSWGSLNPTANRNVLINGNMGIAQRATTAGSITGAGYHTVDRWTFNVDSAGTWTMSQENDAPPGFRKSAKVLCTVANTLAAGDNLTFLQRIEGFNAQGFAKGTASAKPFMLSFWVKSNVTGTYVVELYDIDNTRQVSASYTISSSGTWEYKTIQLPLDTTGQLDYDNNNSLQCTFWLTAGSTFSSGTLNTSWASATNANRAVGQVHLAAAVNNYWQVTGVQLEVGTQASGFENRSYGDELALCQRYYERMTGNAGHGLMPGFLITGDLTATAYAYKVPKRSAPSFTASNFSNLRTIYNGGGTTTISGLNGANIGADAIYFQFQHGNTGLAGQGSVVQFAATNAWIEFASEL